MDGKDRWKGAVAFGYVDIALEFVSVGLFENDTAVLYEL